MSARIVDPTSDKAANVFADPSAYTDEPRLHDALTHLRAHAPVSFVDRRPYRPFWAITEHADVMEIERANDLFISAPRPLLGTAMADDLAQSLLDSGMGLRTLIHLDDPQHRVVRAIGADWFRPKAMRALKVRVDELAKIHVDKMLETGLQTGGECDFVREVAKNYPLYVIMSLLGLPESDFGRMLHLTQACRSPKARRSICPKSRPTATRKCSATRSASTSAETPTSTWHSASGHTSA
jgi:cytochrome P450